ncbi:FAD-dependent 5-carboxymethylaminomethyl-2-thiouridine(34) oxidoreductase MnmC [Shewanella pneumatophori]|uniref:FAD-dependent 5-carboxymethylaminomethyl-2-thiouridine(34) oxidoreductase MnmC n=1 Tax=Shewanella pneumatophori TaxID=314092 RepID=A0A9X1ZCS2_9GAMM|nr:FAD-dependent 5-carboxymethylaminomethyl-2-thiouridine(34) oxidoreductase MnmC [Shewanella pneumatophori]MCL1139238.1 FAD-dependent 5-carboxymethylaminomethyl-2-thiouridine(34) oxidoreductase MnmC [Shewanella pneumatophori]
MTVSKIVQQIIDTNSTNSVVIAQLGLSSLNNLKALVLNQSSARVCLKIFSPIDQTLAQVIKDKQFEQICAHESVLPILAIEGCQRRILNNGRLVIDFHFGPLLQQLQQIPMVNSGFINHWCFAENLDYELLTLDIFWQMAKLSQDNAQLDLDNLNCLQTSAEANLSTNNHASTEPNSKVNTEQTIISWAKLVGLYQNDHLKADDITLLERSALRSQQQQKQAPYPISSISSPQASENALPIAIIGGGVASANLALSLAERSQKVHLFCEDSALAQAASGNKQGAIYPLLTPDNNHLSQYFQQAYLFSLQRLKTLAAQGHSIDYDLCGVVHTGHDERSRKRVAKIIDSYDWQSLIATKITSEQASEIASVKIDDAGILYPLGGWVSPQDFTQAAFKQAQAIADVKLALETQITAIDYQNNAWYLSNKHQRFGPFSALVVANGKSLTQYNQTQYLQATGFRGQVSHAPSRAKLSKLSTVLCAHGYMTPGNNALHCLGASYVKNAEHLDYCPTEQIENLKKIQHSYLEQDWVKDIDISGHSARVGVRMVTRDHAPMMGPAPDIDSILALYKNHQLTPESRKFWQSHPAPTYPKLYVLGGLGSRGLSSGPLAAEALAAQICGENLPISTDFVALLNPNRMWLRKLLKGKALDNSETNV